MRADCERKIRLEEEGGRGEAVEEQTEMVREGEQTEDGERTKQSTGRNDEARRETKGILIDERAPSPGEFLLCLRS